MAPIISATQQLPQVSHAVLYSKPTRTGFSLLQSHILYSNRALFYSRSSFRPLKAILNSPSLTKVADDAKEKGEALTLREICLGRVPEHLLRRVEEVGYAVPTDVQKQALPVLFSGRDCILHAQTGSGKTLAYLLLIFSVINTQRSAVQALIVVPTRELGIQVTKVARMLAATPTENDAEQKSCTVMALLDGGMLRRHKSWLKAEPPTIVVATIASLCQMLEKHLLKLESMQVLVIDERDVVHVHVNPIEPMPTCLQHRFVICSKKQRHQTLLSLLQSDAPKSGIIFVGEQSEKSKKAGNGPPTIDLVDFLKTSYGGCSEILLLEEDMNFNSRAASLSEVRQGGGYLLVATDIAARGVDLPEITHIYNFNLPRTAVDYLHRAGRTGRKPFSDEKCNVTSIIMPEERFVLQRYENELMFNCEELFL
ncbi:DEAD-box ATP-dependent RNA helicase 58, chloroplastic isoform X2 [Populus trichocarpa]|uniref:DEAD-box ATP-dependent RNA helicase 58, chloroplastic isoform X2 n=1 Tax=Populus trichocarpa TaxID=3694 RepID=UPI0022777320|nr:DEAD-box ATP-dependent RNA helicase 58, chloroplastic isoform X2 [Populus trichocarpa]